MSMPPQKPSSASDRRDGSRRRFEVAVGVATDHRLFVGLVSNISAGGLFIATEEALKKGDRVEVRFSIPGSPHAFDKHATVCWTRPLDGTGEGMTRSGAGVQFDDLSDEEQRLLNAFLEHCEPIFYDT
jgi:uncharacterized protein (TIGR02266 family)